jgi:hypothetical protein
MAKIPWGTDPSSLGPMLAHSRMCLAAPKGQSEALVIDAAVDIALLGFRDGTLEEGLSLPANLPRRERQSPTRCRLLPRLS